MSNQIREYGFEELTWYPAVVIEITDVEGSLASSDYVEGGV